MKELLVRALAVGVAGFVGSIARWLVGAGFGRFNLKFPLGTLVINVTGSFFLGWFMTFMAGKDPKYDHLKLAIGTGFVGAYTTFSTYMYETNDRFQQGAHYQAWANLIGSIVLGMIAVYLGTRLAQ